MEIKRIVNDYEESLEVLRNFLKGKFQKNFENLRKRKDFETFTRGLKLSNLFKSLSRFKSERFQNTGAILRIENEILTIGEMGSKIKQKENETGEKTGSEEATMKCLQEESQKFNETLYINEQSLWNTFVTDDKVQRTFEKLNVNCENIAQKLLDHRLGYYDFEEAIISELHINTKPIIISADTKIQEAYEKMLTKYKEISNLHTAKFGNSNLPFSSMATNLQLEEAGLKESDFPFRYYKCIS